MCVGARRGKHARSSRSTPTGLRKRINQTIDLLRSGERERIGGGEYVRPADELLHELCGRRREAAQDRGREGWRLGASASSIFATRSAGGSEPNCRARKITSSSSSASGCGEIAASNRSPSPNRAI